MIKGPKKTVSVILPLDLYEWLAVLAEDTGRSVPGYIRQVLKSYLGVVEGLAGHQGLYGARKIDAAGIILDGQAKNVL